ncbi:MAG: hypothetical protein P8Y26_07810 [Gemmatimonadales bacterium]|jgi:hypothetical protein
MNGRKRPTIEWTIEALGLCAVLLVAGRPGIAQEPDQQPPAQEPTASEAPAQQPPAQEPTPQQRIAALKANLAASQSALKNYEWIETTTVSVKGKEKSRTEDQCYYDVTGTLQKVPVSQSTAPQRRPRGPFGRAPLRSEIAESKKEGMEDYMKSAVALMQSYVPPDPSKLQALQQAGQMTIQPLEPGKTLRLTFSGYEKPGDSFAVDVDLTSNQILNVGIASYLDSQNDPVTMQVKFGMLPGNISYASDITLDAQAKNMTVTAQNTGYRSTGS